MKKRKIGLSIVIVLLALSNFAGIFKLKLTAEQLSQLYTFLSPDEIMWLAIIPVVTIISLFAIWFGKRWGIIMAVIVFTVTLFLDVYYQVWAHALLATAGFVLLMFFCWQSRQFFSLEKNEEPEK